MTPPETAERHPTSVRRRRVATLREWTAVPANVTRGWLLFVVAVAFAFIFFAIYVTISVVRLDNRVTRDRLEAAIRDQVESCQAANDSRDEAKVVALLSVESDRNIWEAIDALFDNGLPEPARTVIFDGLTSRENLIDTTYKHEDCTSSPGTTAG